MSKSMISALIAALCLSTTLCITIRPLAASPFCTDCKGVVGSIQQVMIKANATYEEIVEKNIDINVCDNLPPDVQDTCKSIVDEQIPAIWNSIITEYLDPAETCSSVHLCPPGVHLDSDPVTCHICKKTAQFIDLSIFEDPLIQKKVATKLKKICSQLPGNSTIAQCDKLIDDDISDIMSEIGKAVAANMCTDLELCSSPRSIRVSPFCGQCASILSKMRDSITSEESLYVGSFRSSVQTSVCAKLDLASNTCFAASSAAVSSAWSSVMEIGLDPSRTCRSVGLCGVTKIDQGKGTALTCQICQKLATFIDSDVLEDPSVQLEVASKLKEICSQIPSPRIGNSSVTVQCEKLIDDNTADIMDQIGQVVEARLCEDLAVCAK